MKLEVLTPNFFSLEELKQNINSFELSLLLADCNLKIVAVNRRCADSKTFRIGSRLDKFLKPADRERLLLLDEGKMMVADLVGEASKGYVTVIRGNDCYLVCFRYLADSMVERLCDRFSRFSGYDIGVNAVVSAALSDLGGTVKGKRLSAVIERMLSELSDVHRLRFFDVSASLSALFSTLGEVIPSLANRINIPNVFPETVAIGNGDDLLLISAYALTLCHDCAIDGNIDVSACDGDGGIKISFSCLVDRENGSVGAFVESLCDCDFASKPLDRASFWAFFAKLLADTNLWDISARTVNGRFSLELLIPSVARGEEFYLRDPEGFALYSVLEYFFGE